MELGVQKHVANCCKQDPGFHAHGFQLLDVAQGSSLQLFQSRHLRSLRIFHLGAAPVASAAPCGGSYMFSARNGPNAGAWLGCCGRLYPLYVVLRHWR